MADRHVAHLLTFGVCHLDADGRRVAALAAGGADLDAARDELAARAGG